MEQAQNRPNSTVHLTFKEEVDEASGILFMNIYLEAEGRPITPMLVSSRAELPEGPTLAEVWGFEMLQFVESYLREMLHQGQMNGYVVQMPKKKDMN